MSAHETAVGLGPRVVAERPLSRIQEQIWTSQRLAPATPLANMGHLHRLHGAIDPDRWTRAFLAVVDASDALRTVIVDRPGRAPAARVLAAAPGPAPVIDMPLDELDAWMRERVAVPVDATACGYDSVLIRHADDDWTWWLDLHHVITDAWSSALVYEMTAAAYTALADDDSGPSLDEALGRLVPFGDHLAAIIEAIEADPDGVAKRAAHWRSTAPTDPTPLTPYGPRAGRTTRVRRRPLPDRVTGAVVEPDDRFRSLSADLTRLGLLATALAVTLHRLDGRDEFVLGIPIHHRSGRRAPHVIAPLMELYPLRVRVEPGLALGDVFDSVRRGVLDVIRHARPGESPDVAYDAIVNVLNAGFDDFAGIPATVRWVRSDHVDAAHPIRVQAYDFGDGFRIELDVNDGLSVDRAHDRLPDHVSTVLDRLVSEPDTPVDGFAVLGDDEREVHDALNPPRERPIDERPVHVQIAEALRAAPTSVIAESPQGTLTASELDEQADQLARWLAASGITAGDRVGIRMPRSLDVLVAVHGVLRAGAAFVFLDPDDPSTRHQAIIDDAGIEVVLDELPAAGAHEPADDDRPRAVGPDDLAYVLYTSGSTGTPKGVPIPHRGLADYLGLALGDYRTDEPMVMPLHSSLVFDLTITSLFLPLLAGGRIVVMPGEPLEALSAVAHDRRCTVLKATPSQLDLLVRMIDDPLAVEVLIVGGEAFRRPTAAAIAQRIAPGARIFNEYGPTEAVVGCMLHRWDPDVDLGPDIPIGLASRGTEVYVLDRAGYPAPIGTWGELFVRRPGMTEGYLNLPELSAERFAPIATIDNRPLYRTGDRVRIDRNGVLVYGGRGDDQLKVGGVRLEPGEIEAALVEHPAITTAVVRVWSPNTTRIRRCVRCGLGDDVPDVDIDEVGVCTTCRQFDEVEPQTADWFGTPDDLEALRARATERSSGDFDCLHLLSGGKDSTYALYRLVAAGWRVHALTLDNGYISDGAKENIRRTIADIGISHEFVTTDAMAEIFRDSLDRFANVCNGCYKTIYTLAVARAHELGIPTIVTGLSRGQFFETRLVPHQFEHDRFDPDAIDRTVLQARRAYHSTRDAVTELLPEQRIFERDDIDVLTEIEFVDIYRYLDVDLAEMYEFLESRAPWVRPDDTGRSTNCLINVAGIHVHRTERGYHNYAEPYSWDVRLGHKTRDEALDELDDEIDMVEIERILAEIGYTPKPSEVLTAWYQTSDGDVVDARELASWLRDRLPSRSIPAAFVHVDDLPLASSAKLDVAALPAPSRSVGGNAEYEPPATPTEATCAAIWERILDVGRVGVLDDFFDLGGSSLPALEAVIATEEAFGTELPDALVFEHRRLRDFAAAVDARLTVGEHRPDDIPAPPDGTRPLSAGEEALLFEQMGAPDDTRYNVHRWYSVDAAVDLDRLHAAIATVVDRHEPLHTAYDADRTRLATDDALWFGELPAGDPEVVAASLVAAPFDLAAGPLVRVHARIDDADTTHLLIGMHHISVDAGTFDLLWDEIDAAYHERPMPPLATTYSAHGWWQRSKSDEHLPFWIEQLDHLPTDPTGFPTPATPGPDGYLNVVAPVTADELAAASATTPFATALAAAAVVVGAFRADDRASIAITASTKDHPAADPLIGYALTTLPVGLDLDPRATVGAIDAAAGDAVAAMLPHRSAALSAIAREARARGRSTPDVSCMLAYERLAPARFGDAHAAHRILHSGTAVSDLTFFVQERESEVRLAVEHRGSVIDGATAQRILDAFVAVVEAICRHPHRTVASVQAQLGGADLIGSPLPDHEPTVIDAIVNAADRAPEAAAVTDGDGTTTYGELIARAQAIAGEITDAGSPARVGVAVRRSRAMVEAIVGVQLAGSAYVPIDPTLPPARQDAIVAAAALDVVVADSVSASALGDLRIIDVEASSPAPSDRSTGPLPTADDTAYVIFTSGSTGEPAGVAVSHANLAASTAARSGWYEAPPARFLLTPSIGFDSSMVGLFWPLTTGGTVVVPSDDDVHDVDRLGALIAEHEISHLLMVPSLYRALLARRPHDLRTLATAIVAGEACSPDVVAAHHAALPSTALVNEYGPTEATVWAAAHRCTPDDDPVPIGGPIPGGRLRVADHRLRPMPTGAAGELLIAGPGVTAGYLSGRDSAAFVDDGEHRWYRTGDVVRADVGGRLHFLGRVDDQLNVGGMRVEPIEIESQLTALTGVDDAVVVAARVDGRAVLVAHLVGDARAFDAASVRRQLAEQLAAAAVPRHFAFHAELPRTSNGKLDRVAAAQLVVAVPVVGHRDAAADDVGDEFVQPVVDIWRSALGDPDITADGDFFALGGDSLAAVEIVTALEALVGDDVPVATLLAAPTPRSMTERLGVASAADAGTAATASLELVMLRSGRTGGGTVVMAAAWDDVQSYRALADAFPEDVAIVGLAVQDESGRPSPLHEVGPMVDAAIQLLDDRLGDRVGDRPLIALGWSIGGIVAQHLGAALDLAGRRIDAVVLVDSFFPGEDRHLWSNRWWKYKSMMRPGGFVRAGREFGDLFHRRLQRYAARIGRRLMRFAGQPLPTTTTVSKTKAGVPVHALDHQPVTSNVPLVLYAANTTNPRRTVHRWRTVAPNMTVVPIQGRHRGFESIMGADRVHQVVDDLVERHLT